MHGLQGVTLLQEDETSATSAASSTAAAAVPPPPPSAAHAPGSSNFRPRERAVPATPLGRAVGFAGLGASLLWGTVRESVSRTFKGAGAEGQHPSSAWISEQNAERLANALCRMR